MISPVSKKQRLKEKLHHAWSLFLLSLAIIIVLAAIALTLIRESTPLLANHHQTIQTWLSKRLKHPITIGALSAGWRGFEPIIKIHDVTIENAQHQPMVHLGYFSVGFNLFKTLFSGQLKIGLVALSDGQLRIVQLTNGDTEIYADSKVPLAVLSGHHQGRGGLIKSLFEINKIYLSQIHVDWLRKDGRQIDFQNVRLEISNHKKSHHMWGIARLKQPSTGALAFVANFKGNIINKESINGSVYIHGNKLDLEQWTPVKKLGGLAVTNGFVDGRAWGVLTKGKVTSVQTDFLARAITLKNHTTNKDFVVNKLSANVSWVKQPNGWTVSADKLKLSDDLKKSKKVYLKFQRTTGGPEFEGYVSNLSSSLLKKIIILSNNSLAKKYIEKYSLSGLIKNVYVNYSSKEHYEASFEAGNVSLQTKGDKLDLKNLAASVYLFPNMGSVSLSSKHFGFNDTSLQKESIILKPFVTHLYWYKQNGILTLYCPKIDLANKDIDLLGTVKTSIPLSDPGKMFVNLSLATTDFDLNKIKNYLPKKITKKEHFLDFLKHAFKAGSASMKLKLHGPLESFPYQSLNTNLQGDFFAKMQLNNVALNYKPGWPIIKHLNGVMNIHDGRLTILGEKATLYKTNLKKIYAIIPNIIDKKQPEMFVRGNVQGSLQRAEQFIKNTPLNKTLGKKLENLNFKGAMSLNLKLKLPLKPHTFNTKASGTVDMANASISMPHLGLQFTQVNGELEFGHRILTAKNIKGLFYNEPILIDINTLVPNTQKSITQLNFWSEITAETLQKRFPNKYINSLSGLTSFHAVLDLYNRDKAAANHLAITSNLMGLTSILPEPFRFMKKTPKHFNAVLAFDGHKPMYLTAELGKDVHFAEEMRRQKDGFHFYSGDLHFGTSKAKQQQQAGLLIGGALPYFNWKQWRPYLINSGQKQSAQKSMLRLVSLKIKEVDFYNYLFMRTQVQLTEQQKQWRLFANGPALNGEIYLPTTTNNKIKASLKRLYLNPPIHDQSNENNAFNPQELPSLNVTVGDFRFGPHVYGQINLQTRQTKKGLDIQDIHSGTERYNFNAHGYWNSVGNKESAGLQGSLDAKSISSLLSKFNLSNSIDAKNLQMNFNLHWPKSIFKPTFKTLSGNIKLATGAGTISDIGSKANNELATGQMLTFLSLQSLQKRIFLNFNDLNSKGFHFEKMSGDFRVNNGNAWTSDATIDGIVASIALEGRIGFANKDFSLFTQITPHVTSSLPIIATLAGGPIIGAAAYVVNKIFSPSLNHMAARYFRITGPWSKPEIKAVQVKKSKAKGPDRFKDF